MNRRSVFSGLAAVGAGVLLVGCGGTQANDMSGYNTHSLDNGTNPVSSGTSFGAATLGVKLIPLDGKPAFIVGANVQSFTGAPELELGKNPLTPNAGVGYDPKVTNASIQDLASSGCNLLRYPVFTKLNGLTLDSKGMVTGLDETFVKNLSDMLHKAAANRLNVYLTLGEPWAGLPVAKDPITDADAKTAFFKNALVPLVQKLKGRAGVVGLDLVDNIETEVAGKDGNGTKRGITWDQARDYIKAAALIVKSADPQRLVSAGSGTRAIENIQSGKYAKLGLDFYDAHLYDDKGTLPAFKALKVDRPVLIGSCGQASRKSDDEVQTAADLAFLTNASKQGYAGAVITDYSKDAENPLSLLTKDGKHRPVFAQVQKFVATLAMSATTPGAGLGTSSPTSQFGK